jgi:glycosyltransferase involved in cell wall biosynthesis
VDDGSPDNALDVIKTFKDDRIRIISQSNRGLSGARNTGINASRGIFIALLDADDLWLPNKLASHFRHFQSDPSIDISYSASAFIDEQGKPMHLGQYPKINDISAKDVFCRNPNANGTAAVNRKSLQLKITRNKIIVDTHRVEYID